MLENPDELVESGFSLLDRRVRQTYKGECIDNQDMRYIFEGKDITNRNIHLSDERWHHIAEEHPEVTPYFVEFGDILKHPIKVVSYIEDPLVRYFYRYYKQRISAAKYLMLIVKYLNGEGFIITAYFTRYIT